MTISLPSLQDHALFDDTHDAIRSNARRFVTKHIQPNIDTWEEQGCLPRWLFREAAQAGFSGLGYPETYGGSGGDILHKIVWVEELMMAGSGGLVASLCSLDIGLPPIIRFAGEDVKNRLVPQVLSGEKIAALAITEPGGGSDVASITTTATPVSIDGTPYYRVNGIKSFITSGTQADIFTVAVRTGTEGHQGISLLVIERDTKGFSSGPALNKMGWRCSDTAELFFDDCLVPACNLIGRENQGFKLIGANFQNERLNLAIMANMTSFLALQSSLAYVHSRSAFGGKLADKQVIQHRLADMATRYYASREFTYHCANRLCLGNTLVKEISMAKNMATDVCEQVTHDAVQLFGGNGYMTGSLVERLYRDGRLLSIGGGTREIMNEIIFKHLVKEDLAEHDTFTRTY